MAADDASLMAAAARGDRGAFRVVFERHVDAVRGYVAMRVGRDAADDVVAETFATAWHQRARFRRDAASARPWLYGIATNMVRRDRDAEQRWQASVVAAQQQPAPGDPSSDSDDAFGIDVVLRAVARLKPHERDVLLLTALAELSPAEIADALGISNVAVRVRLSRARRAASRQIQEERGRT